MEESISGFKTNGDWGDVVEHGERITQALVEVGVSDLETDLETAFEEWDDWRPKAHERLETDVNEKTAEQAHLEEGEGEKAGKGPGDDIRTAGEKLTESYERLDDDDTEQAVRGWKKSVGFVRRAADTAGRKAVRRFEDTVYQRVMTQMSPYYFDNELVSANIQQTSRGNGDEFVFEVNINDDELKSEVSDALAVFDDEIDRWHVEVEKDTDSAEVIEGAEPPPEFDDPSRPTRN
ncbi:DUF5828 family protein [Natrialbaceae archaeon AArc-T1-2]|uniref:DUF5828 family protein n=1 Tax=Natrialbaceae archaeon AArc-T1-2 TaxID=3053904 RepID=UPI00255ACEB3|nr:DUF5828 family protein [Natrialbaceae archaeon AArc-T1-2]WIV68209.1 DUF5828 family protein [Natrialbaceae archaeon AArc-T1-2]